MNRFNKIMLGSLAAILFTAMTVEPPKINMYKDSHNYSVEERELTE